MDDLFAPSAGHLKPSLVDFTALKMRPVTFIADETSAFFHVDSAQESSSTTVLCHASRKEILEAIKDIPQGRISERTGARQVDVPFPHDMEERVGPSGSHTATHCGGDDGCART